VIFERFVREQRAMSNVTRFAGVDYHQDELRVCVLSADKHVVLDRTCGNDVAGLARLLQEAGGVGEVALEACCGSASFGEALASAGPWRVSLAHAGYVSRLRGSPDKTDKSDARLLADLTRVGYLPRVWLAPEYIRNMRLVVGRRRDLIDARRAAKLRVRGLLREKRVTAPAGLSGPWSAPWRAWARSAAALGDEGRWVMGELLDEVDHLDGRIDAAEKRLRELTGSDKTVARLMEIEGVGEVTAWELRAAVGEFSRFRSGKQLARFCGLSPCNVSTGKRQADAGLIDACDRRLRATLIQAGQRLVRSPGRWGELGRRLMAGGKHRNVAVAAVANRWMRWMHHEMTREEAEKPKSL
jgi:transposase